MIPGRSLFYSFAVNVRHHLSVPVSPESCYHISERLTKSQPQAVGQTIIDRLMLVLLTLSGSLSPFFFFFFAKLIICSYSVLYVPMPGDIFSVGLIHSFGM